MLNTRFPDTPLAANFSFNDHRSACPRCRGLGSITVPDENKFITHPEKSLLKGALDGHKTGRFYGEPDGQYIATLRAVGQKFDIDFAVPWVELSAEARGLALDGAGNESFAVDWQFQRGENEQIHHFETNWLGFRGHILAEYTRQHADHRGQAMLAIMKRDLCPDCEGRRLAKSALSWTFAGSNMADLCAMSVQESLQFFAAAPVPEQLGGEIIARLQTLNDLGLGYLNLDRSIESLSGGESQRVRLARQLGLRLRGITYVLDEPTLGLHPHDTNKLWQTICRLRDDGNTVVLVEHDLEIIRRADWVIDLGPGGGAHGGRILVQGTPQEVQAHATSVTASALRTQPIVLALSTADFGKTAIPKGADLVIRGAALNNLQNLDVGFRTGSITAVIGVSGSGKSSLVLGTLAASAHTTHPVGCVRIDGLAQFTSVVSVGKASQAATSGSNPATMLGVMDPVRKLLAACDTAKALKLSKKHFATAQPGGRCEECKGRGHLTISLDFLADVTKVCPGCQGSGFTDQVLQCRVQGLNLAQILELTITEAATVFADSKKLGRTFALLDEVGLGYLQLGQETGTLSGGERQRLNLVRELLTAGQGVNLYLCDEPSAGLHESDIALLTVLFRKLAAAGHTVIFTEHHPGLIAQADQVVEMGGQWGGLCRI